MTRATPMRRGVAEVELMLALPFFMILMAAIVSGGIVAMNRLQVSLRVRREAWAQRDGAPPAARLGLADGSILGIGRIAGAPTDAGLARSSISQTVALASVFSRTSHTASFEHAVMGGSWDYHSIDFPRRAPMQPDPKYAVYLPGAFVSLPF